MNNISKKKIQQPENKLTALLKILINLKFKHDCLKKYIRVYGGGAVEPLKSVNSMIFRRQLVVSPLERKNI